MNVSASATHRAVEAVHRAESPRLVAALTRMVRDVGLAEELAQDALVVALERWPASGIPDRPGAWLLTTARHRALDRLRRGQMAGRKLEELGHLVTLSAGGQAPDVDAMLDDPVGDDLLRLVFMACHPVLSPEARTALALRLLCGLTTEEIARAFLVPEPTVAQRLVRARKTLQEKRVPFDVPRGEQLQLRLPSVLEVVYLVFNEGYAATRGEDWMRPELCRDALRLGRMLANLAPDHAEVHGLLSLMELQASRIPARTGSGGQPLPLAEQDRARWDADLVQRGLAALDRATELDPVPGTYTLQAAIAACHARAPSTEETDWALVAGLYGVLLQRVPSPVVELNRAVAVSMAHGPEAALPLVDALADEPSLRGYHLLPAVRGDLLARCGRTVEARAELERAAGLARNAAEKEMLLARARALVDGER